MFDFHSFLIDFFKMYTIYSRFKRLIGASEIFLLNRISLISKDTYLLSKIQEHVLFEDYQLSWLSFR